MPLFSCSNKSNSSGSSSSSEDYINPSSNISESEEPEDVEPVYDEEPDSLDGVDVNDLSQLYNAFNNFGDNYTSIVKGYFNDDGSYDYYRHYQKNYVLDKTNYYLEDVQYTIPERDAYLSVCNDGLINLNNNYYHFSLSGSSKEERMSSTLTSNDLTDEISNKRYQDDMFTVNDLKQTYFEEKGFTRVSSNKYECTNKDVCEQFISICATDLINRGHYLTFWKVTIETNPDTEHALRIRLYVPDTQIGKLIDSHRNQENKPNWYLLFSETLISNVGTTSFAPANSLID